MTAPTRITLTEYQAQTLPLEAIPLPVARLIQSRYGQQIKLESSRLTDEWVLTNQGWVGTIPLTPQFQVRLQAKVPLQNLLGMVAYAFDLKRFRFLDHLTDCDSLAQVHERLAHKLASLILQRVRQGIYRSYLSQTGRLSHVRGRIDLPQTWRHPASVSLPCRYDEQTTDIPDNQILAWTLQRILRTELAHEPTVSTVRRAYLALRRLVTLTPHAAENCLHRSYHRLNHDYERLHHLCYFFLTMSGPSHQIGNQKSLPFLVNMASLYERFVAAWLERWVAKNPACGVKLRQQERVNLDEQGQSFFKIDLVLSDHQTGDTVCVLDSKYKTAATINPTDIQQVVAYAEAKACHEAILIYPMQPHQTEMQVGRTRVRCLAFSLHQDLEQAGQQFIQALELNTS